MCKMLMLKYITGHFLHAVTKEVEVLVSIDDFLYSET